MAITHRCVYKKKPDALRGGGGALGGVMEMVLLVQRKTGEWIERYDWGSLVNLQMQKKRRSRLPKTNLWRGDAMQRRHGAKGNCRLLFQ